LLLFFRAQIANGGLGSAGGGTFYGETYAEGDVIGMKLDMYRRELSYYKNGKHLGVAFTDLPQVKL
jgi:Ran-binding protein 9/10